MHSKRKEEFFSFIPFPLLVFRFVQKAGPKSNQIFIGLTPKISPLRVKKNGEERNLKKLTYFLMKSGLQSMVLI
jgi:hypothetical protein